MKDITTTIYESLLGGKNLNHANSTGGDYWEMNLLKMVDIALEQWEKKNSKATKLKDAKNSKVFAVRNGNQIDIGTLYIDDAHGSTQGYNVIPKYWHPKTHARAVDLEMFNKHPFSIKRVDRDANGMDCDFSEYVSTDEELFVRMYSLISTWFKVKKFRVGLIRGGNPPTNNMIQDEWDRNYEEAENFIKKKIESLKK